MRKPSSLNLDEYMLIAPVVHLVCSFFNTKLFTTLFSRLAGTDIYRGVSNFVMNVRPIHQFLYFGLLMSLKNWHLFSLKGGIYEQWYDILLITLHITKCQGPS